MPPVLFAGGVVIEVSVNSPCQIPLEQPTDLPITLTVCAPFVYVASCFGIVDHPNHGHDVEGSVQLPIAPAVEPVSDGVAGGRWDGVDTGKGCEFSFRAHRSEERRVGKAGRGR